MEWAPRTVVLAGFFERDAAINNINDIDSREQIVDKILGDTSFCGHVGVSGAEVE